MKNTSFADFAERNALHELHWHLPKAEDSSKKPRLFCSIDAELDGAEVLSAYGVTQINEWLKAFNDTDNSRNDLEHDVWLSIDEDIAEIAPASQKLPPHFLYAVHILARYGDLMLRLMVIRSSIQGLRTANSDFARDLEVALFPTNKIRLP